MLRRAANVGMLAVAAALIVYNAPLIEVDPRRAVLVLALILVGVFLNFTGLLLPRCAVRPLLRGLGCAVFLILAAGFAALALAIGRETVAPAAKADPEVGRSLAAAVGRFFWLAAAAAHIAVSLMLLPPVGVRASPEKPRAARDLLV